MLEDYGDKGLRIVGVSFDDSRDKAEEVLLSSVSSTPLATAVKALNVKIGKQDPKLAVLTRLEELGVELGEPAARNAVVATLERLGVDFEKLRAGVGTTESKIFGDKLLLHMADPEMRDQYYSIVGQSGLPQTFIIDREGILRFHGYPAKEHVEDLVKSLLEPASDTESF